MIRRTRAIRLLARIAALAAAALGASGHAGAGTIVVGGGCKSELIVDANRIRTAIGC